MATIELGPKAPAPLDAGEPDDAQFLSLMAQLQARWGCKRVSLCRKVRDASGLQRRWSLMTTLPEGGTFSTHSLPIRHTPKDDLGGGSAWAAGMIHALHVSPVASPMEAMRRADLVT